MQYWINISTSQLGTIHTAACYESMASGYVVSENWRGPYASRGGAIDAILSMEKRPWESQCCITESRVNDE